LQVGVNNFIDIEKPAFDRLGLALLFLSLSLSIVTLSLLIVTLSLSK
jgi:hypothetical protein